MACSAQLIRRLQVALASLSAATEIVGILNGAEDATVLTFVGATGINQLVVPDNLADALSIQEGSNKYITIVTTDGSEAIQLKKNLTLTDAITLTNSANVTGTSLWASGDKGAFFGASPIAKPANTVDYLTGLVNLGLRASGGTASIAAPGSITSSAPTGGGIGYATGAGGAQAQASSITTTVVLSKLTGQITTVASTLGALASVQFTVTNTTVAATDTILLSTTYAGAGSPTLTAVKVTGGAFDILICNGHASAALNAALVINFTVLKAVAS